jgi:hypothetical protein
MMLVKTDDTNRFVADRDRVALIDQREVTRFRERTRASNALRERALAVMPAGVPNSWMAGYYSHPQLFADHGEGASFLDPDGNRYVDMNVSDLSMTIGFGVPEIEEALARQYSKGAHFLLPTEDAIISAELLAAQTGMPAWQFTVSASGSNTDIMRIARHMTGRRKLVVFEGKYHGHLEETLVVSRDGHNVPEYQGISGKRAEDTIILPFNDLEAASRVLKQGDVALVLTEPTMTNCSLVMPDPGFLEGLRKITRETGTMLCIDEAHTYSFAYGGLTRKWHDPRSFGSCGAPSRHPPPPIRHRPGWHALRQRAVDGGGQGDAGACTHGGRLRPYLESGRAHGRRDRRHLPRPRPAVPGVSPRAAVGHVPDDRAPAQLSGSARIDGSRHARCPAGVHGQQGILGLHRQRRAASIFRS